MNIMRPLPSVSEINEFQRYAALGYRIITPVFPPEVDLEPWCASYKKLHAKRNPRDDRGKVPGEKQASGRWSNKLDWGMRAPRPSELVKWKSWSANLGVVTVDNLVAIDADTLNLDLARLIKAEIEATIGRTPIRIGRYPKALYPVRCSEPFGHQEFYFDNQEGKFEILAGGNQFVAQGVHPVTRQPYTWPVPIVPLGELPIVTPETLHALMAALRAKLPDAGSVASSRARTGPPVPQASLMSKPDLMAHCVRHTPNTYPARADYIKYGYAIKAALIDEPELARDLWEEWCKNWEGGENEDATIESDWNGFKPPFETGWRHILKRYEEATGRDERPAHWCEDIVEEASEEPPAETWTPLFPDSEDAPAARTLEGDYYDFPEASSLEPEDFLYDSWMVRDYVSLISAQTKVGKSLLMISIALAMASGKPLLGVSTLRPLRVRIWNGEDTILTMKRRIAACMKNFGLTRADIGDRLIINSGRDQPIVVAVQARDGAKIIAPVADELISYLQKQAVDVLVIDPFIKAHRVSENDNAAIDAVAQEWVRVAGQGKVAVVLVHHSRKLNGNEASVDDSRGASSLPSAARSTLVLARMTKKEGEKAGRSKTYKSLFRIADSASNLAAAPGDDTQWFEIASVDLGNARFAEDGSVLRRSDRVGVARLSGITGGMEDEGDMEQQDMERRAMDEIAKGGWRRDVRAGDGWAGIPIGRAFRIDMEDADGKAQIKAMISRWLLQGKLTEETLTDKNRNKRTFLCVQTDASGANLFD